MLLKERKKSELTFNCKKTEYIVVSKRVRPGCVVQIGDVKIKLLHKLSFWRELKETMENVLQKSYIAL